MHVTYMKGYIRHNTTYFKVHIEIHIKIETISLCTPSFILECCIISYIILVVRRM